MTAILETAVLGAASCAFGVVLGLVIGFKLWRQTYVKVPDRYYRERY